MYQRTLTGKMKSLMAIAMLAGAGVGQVHAANFELQPTGEWLNFVALGDNSPWLDAAGEEATFSFSSDQAFTLRLVDLLFPGDTVTVYANGQLLGGTPEVSFDDSLIATTGEEAFGQAAWSQANWQMDAGSYTFSGVGGIVPNGGTLYAISVTPIPEPSSVAMVLAAMLVVGSTRPRRTKAGAQN